MGVSGLIAVLLPAAVPEQLELVAIVLRVHFRRGRGSHSLDSPGTWKVGRKLLLFFG